MSFFYDPITHYATVPPSRFVYIRYLGDKTIGHCIQNETPVKAGRLPVTTVFLFNSRSNVFVSEINRSVPLGAKFDQKSSM